MYKIQCPNYSIPYPPLNSFSLCIRKGYMHKHKHFVTNGIIKHIFGNLFFHFLRRENSIGVYYSELFRETESMEEGYVYEMEKKKDIY